MTILQDTRRAARRAGAASTRANSAELSVVEAETSVKDAAAGPRAMARVIRLFEVLAESSSGLTLSELSAAVETPKSTLLNSLRALVQDDFLVVDGPLYRLGPGAFRLASRITAAWSLPRVMTMYLRELQEASQESVGLAMPDWAARRAVYVEVIQSTRPVMYAMRAGISAPLYASAAGRVMLAHAPRDYLETYFETTRFKRLTPQTETDPITLRRELESVRINGYWVSIGQLLEDTATIAAPVFDAQSQIVAAISIGAPKGRLVAARDELAETIVRIARRASGKIASE